MPTKNAPLHACWVCLQCVHGDLFQTDRLCHTLSACVLNSEMLSFLANLGWNLEVAFFVAKSSSGFSFLLGHCCVRFDLEVT